MAAQRVAETPKEINEWRKGTISVPELLLMSFQENSAENLILEYPSGFESGRRKEGRGTPPSARTICTWGFPLVPKLKKCSDTKRIKEVSVRNGRLGSIQFNQMFPKQRAQRCRRAARG